MANATVPDTSPQTSLLNLLLGRPLRSSEHDEQKIGVFAGVPALGLDGLGSAAYGPEAALTILIPLGAAGLHYIGPITFVILGLLAMLYLSYRQTIAAYPVNGGSYTVAKENLGRWAGLLAASALMIDYTLNVAVGISAGVAALTSAAPSLHHHTLPLCLGILGVITLLNLRGTPEAGLAFALPTYTFMACLLVTIGWGVARAVTSGGHPHAAAAPPELAPATEAAGVWLFLRAFASGCTAMTGVEAVSNGVSAFREPGVRNAHRTLTVIVVTLGILLAGIAYLAHAFHIGAMDQDKPGYQSVLSQLVSAVAGRDWFYYVTIGSVLAVLCLSANTSFVDFPRLCHLIAKDDFLPRAFANKGRRLVFSVGVLFLAAMAALLLIAFRGITDRLIPLFAVGAFGAFTLSQAGMVMHWHKLAREKHQDARWWPKWVNGLGAVTTGIALAVILAAKFIEGAWITLLAIPVLLLLFRSVHRYYQRVERQVAVEVGPLDLTHNDPPVVLMPMRRWDRLTARAVRFGLRLSPEFVAVHLNNLAGEEAAHDEARQVRQQWAERVAEPAERAGVPVPRLACVRSPYRRFTEPLLDQIDVLRERFPHREIAVMIPELVATRWWQRLLHRNKAAKLRAALRQRGDLGVVVIDVPWYVDA